MSQKKCLKQPKLSLCDIILFSSILLSQSIFDLIAIICNFCVNFTVILAQLASKPHSAYLFIFLTAEI